MHTDKENLHVFKKYTSQIILQIVHPPKNKKTKNNFYRPSFIPNLYIIRINNGQTVTP